MFCDRKNSIQICIIKKYVTFLFSRKSETCVTCKTYIFQTNVWISDNQHFVSYFKKEIAKSVKKMNSNGNLEGVIHA